MIHNAVLQGGKATVKLDPDYVSCYITYQRNGSSAIISCTITVTCTRSNVDLVVALKPGTGYTSIVSMIVAGMPHAGQPYADTGTITQDGGTFTWSITDRTYATSIDTGLFQHRVIAFEH